MSTSRRSPAGPGAPPSRSPRLSAPPGAGAVVGVWAWVVLGGLACSNTPGTSGDAGGHDGVSGDQMTSQEAGPSSDAVAESGPDGPPICSRRLSDCNLDTNGDKIGDHCIYYCYKDADCPQGGATCFECRYWMGLAGMVCVPRAGASLAACGAESDPAALCNDDPDCPAGNVCTWHDSTHPGYCAPACVG